MKKIKRTKMTKINLDNIMIQLEAQLGDEVENIEDVAKKITGFHEVWTEGNKIYATKSLGDVLEYHRFVDSIKAAKEHMHYQIEHEIK